MTVSAATQETQTHLVANLARQLSNHTELANHTIKLQLQTSALAGATGTQTYAATFGITDSVTQLVRRWTFTATLTEADAATLTAGVSLD